MSKKVFRSNEGRQSANAYDQVVYEMFTHRHRQEMSENVKRGLKLRKERLEKLKTPASTSVSKKTK